MIQIDPSAVFQDAERAAVVAARGVRSFISVPIVAPGGAIVGSLSAAIDSTSTREAYTNHDLPFVAEVGRRAGAAIENARSYERERRLAVEWQAASLPTTLSNIDGLALDADYRPGSAKATIGGDWYDAFQLLDGRIVLTIGDVLGRGLRAAVTMTKLRQAMQAAALVDPDPNVILRVADMTLRLADPDSYATALAAVYDPVDHRLRLASAGHPGPALHTSGGDVREIACLGMMLGLRDGSEANSISIDIPSAATLVFYTDGLVESTRDLEDGQRRLHDALAALASARTGNPARFIVDFVLEGRSPSDDIAVLVARFGTVLEPG